MMCGFGVRAHRYFQCRAGMSRDGRQPQALVSRTRTSNLALVTFTSDDHHARECRVRRIPGDLGLTVPMPGRSFPSHLLPWWTLTWGKVVPEVHRRGQSPSCLSPRTCRIHCLFVRRHWNDGAIRQMAREHSVGIPLRMDRYNLGPSMFQFRLCLQAGSPCLRRGLDVACHRHDTRGNISDHCWWNISDHCWCLRNRLKD